MNWLKIIIPLSLTLGPHLTLLSLFELSSRSTSEQIELEPTRFAQFTPVSMTVEPLVVSLSNKEDAPPKEDNPPSVEETDLPSGPSSSFPDQLKKEMAHSIPNKKSTQRRKCSTSSFVSQHSGQSYALDEERFSYLLRTPKEANNLATLSWSTTKAGVTKGVRIKRIPCSSPLRAMGLTPGMIITHINGQAITTNSDLYKAYRSVKKSSSFTLRGKKQGQAIERLYTISSFDK